MNQERRNKRNAQYNINLEKRNGVTKKYDYLNQGTDGIEKSQERNPMDGHYEFVTTRNKKGDVVSKNKFIYKWTAQAKAIQKLYHETKNGIKPKEKKPIELFFNIERTKEEIKEYFTKKNAARKISADNRGFSPLHYKLIEGLYMNNKQIQIIKNTEAAAQHEQKIKDLMHKLMISKANKPSFKLFKKTKKNNETNLSSLNIAA